MKALVLAAGEGTRLGPLTRAVPKAMIPIGGVPVLERNVRWLVRNGVSELAVNLHHLPDAIRAHFGDGATLGARIRYSYEPELLGTAGALLPLRDWFGSEPFLVVYGDNLVELRIDALKTLHERRAADCTVALWQREDTSASGVAELVDDRMTRFVEKPRPGETESRWVSAGVLLCGPVVLDLINRTPLDFGRDILPALLGHGTVVGYRMRRGETLEWIDTPEDLARVEHTLGQNPRP